ncbi:MAG: EamA family transporter [Alphaproteobacteria bacterium]|nr:EamA family transporter [Alphaproteobacteria bacterium]MDX5370414.1 EamA family transporter [Alphaproteobacteria bacterium]MDX5464922.1 EamA family transporter [Alphaproteobacteria bacterium]
MSRGRATAVGFTAVLMWALLALFTAASGQVPPFQLAAMSFLVGGALGLARMAARVEARAALRQPIRVWVLGIGGLFGYHALYFTALRNAPPVEAGLIAYLWPLLIVVCSALLPGERLRVHHVAGALLGFAGAALIVTKGESLSLDPAYTLGYLAALGCAGTWTAYSLLSRRFPDVPTDAVTGFCLATSVLAACAHVLVEKTVWPDGTGQWLAVLGLGLGPVGLAFYTWDYGCKMGDIQVLGASSYAAPLLSTLVLILAGFAEATWPVAGAALLIAGGAMLASRDLIAPRAQPPG